MSFAVPRRQLKKSEDYRKTPMKLFLTQPVIASLREFVKLPNGVTDARSMLMMFIDHHREFQTGKPSHTLDNLVQHALTYRATTRTKLNLTMETDDEEGEPEVEEEAPQAKKTKKVKIEIPEDDEELAEEVEKTRKRVLRSREVQQLQQRLAELQHQEEEEEAE
jgi:hypothetical protein